MRIQYHIDTTECCCDSPQPIGGCLHCDLKRIRNVVEDLVDELESRIRQDGHDPETTMGSNCEAYRSGKELLE